MEHKLDNIDKKIIEILQINARTPVKEIAKEVFLSSPAVSARIDHLEKSGVITGYHAQLNPEFLGIILRLLLIWRWSRCRNRCFILLLKKFRM